MLIPLPEILQSFPEIKIKGVLHVGAHECEEAQAYGDAKVSKTIWIDANEDLVLTQKMKGHDVHCVVVSDVDNQETPFYITNNFQSSSILPLGTHLQMHPHIYVKGVRTLKTKRLDTFLKEQKVDMSTINFLNLDIQGVELKALKGMGEQLKFIDTIYTEVNEKELYKGCDLLPAMDSFLEKNGFVRKAMNMTEFGWGDALYIRTLKL